MATTLSLLRFAPLPPRLTRSPFTTNLTTSPNRSVRIYQPRVAPISSSYAIAIPAIRRAISMLAYTIPFLNSLPFSRHLHSRYPLIANLTSPLLALQDAPLLSIASFFVFYFLLALNPNVSQFVRFNAMQAMALDVILTFLHIVRSFVGTPSSKTGIKLREFSDGAIFVLGVMTSVYCVLCCLVGYTPHLSFVSSFVIRVLGFKGV